MRTPGTPRQGSKSGAGGPIRAEAGGRAPPFDSPAVWGTIGAARICGPGHQVRPRMNPSTLAEILTTARAMLEEMAPEVRNRCADTTHLRLQGVIQSLDTAAGLAVAAPAEPAPGATAEAEPAPGAALPSPDLVAIDASTLGTLIEVLGDRIAIEVRAALDQAKAQDQARG